MKKESVWSWTGRKPYEAIKELFPKTDHQLGLTHFKRNIIRNMSQADAKNFKEQFEQSKVGLNFGLK
jgi:transposase-like protein